MKTTTFVRVIGERLMWAFFPLVTLFTLSEVSPLWSAGISSSFAALFFTATAALQGWPGLKKAIPWRDIVLSTLIIGVWFYALNFIALNFTTVGNQALLLQLQVLSAYGISVWWVKEKDLGPRELAGAMLLIVSAVVVLKDGWTGLNIGDGIIILAALTVSFGNVYTKWALQKTDPVTILMVRQWLAAFLLSTAAYFFESPAELTTISLPVWGMMALSGVLLLGFSKWLFYKNLDDLGIGRVSAFIPLAAPITFLLGWLILDEPFTWGLVFALLLSGVGMWLMKGPQKKPPLQPEE